MLWQLGMARIFRQRAPTPSSIQVILLSLQFICRVAKLIFLLGCSSCMIFLMVCVFRSCSLVINPLYAFQRRELLATRFGCCRLRLDRAWCLALQHWDSLSTSTDSTLASEFPNRQTLNIRELNRIPAELF